MPRVELAGARGRTCVCWWMLRFAELGLKAQGVQKIYYHVKQTKDFGRLLEHLGYQDVERMYAR